MLFIFLLFNGGCGILGVSDDPLPLTYKDPIHFNLDDLDYVKQELKKENNPYEEAYNKLIIQANKALNSYGYSVVTKEEPAPNGNKHEYVSRGRYWWPNPEIEDGLPYVKRDGNTNPEIYQFDRVPLASLRDDVETLSIVYYLTGNEKYAQKAISLINRWFIDKQTKMKPNLQFAQGIPGLTSGRPNGIIDGLDFYRLLNYVPILKKSDRWSNKINIGLNKWFYNYYMWLLKHDFGKAARETSNNHGTWYDVQVGTYAYFFNDEETLAEVLARVRNKRIPGQIASNGQQVSELNRTLSLHYSTYNLEALSILANLQYKSQKGLMKNNSSKGIWNYTTDGSGSIEDAIQFLIPYIGGEKTWNFEQIEKYEPCSSISILKRAYDRFEKEIYKETYQLILANNPSCIENKSMILFPVKNNGL